MGQATSNPFSIETLAAVGGGPWVLNTATAIGATVQAAVVVDVDDSDTIKDLAGHSISADAGVVVAASSDFRSMTGLKHFTTLGTTPAIDFDGATAGDRPEFFMPSNTDRWVFMQFNAYTSSSGGDLLFDCTDGDGYAYLNSGGLATHIAGQNRGTASTTFPTAVQFSVGINFSTVSAADSTEFFFGLESGALAADGTSSNQSNTDSNLTVKYIGCDAGGDGITAAVNIFATGDGGLTLAQFQSLHDDWKAELVTT